MLAVSEAVSASSNVDDPSIHNSERRESKTWSFRAYVRLIIAFSNLLDVRRQLMDTALASASVISWASTNTAQIQTKDSNGKYFEGFVHASTLIRLGSLRRVLPDRKTTDAGKIVEVTFEEVHPGPGKDYICQHTLFHCAKLIPTGRTRQIMPTPVQGRWPPPCPRWEGGSGLRLRCCA
jgi:hypothetical protein